MSKIAQVKSFFADVTAEMKQVSWPTRQELFNSTLLVIVSVFALAVFLGMCDIILSRALNLIIK